MTVIKTELISRCLVTAHADTLPLKGGGHKYLLLFAACYEGLNKLFLEIGYLFHLKFMEEE